MRINWDLSNTLQAIALIVSCLCGKVDLGSESEKISKVISRSLSAFSIVYLALGCLSLDGYFVMAVLRFSQKNWVGICLYIFIFALIPPVVASWERKKRSARIEQSYVKWNLIYNLLGALSTCVMFMIAHDIIGDFSYLKEFQIEGIVSILISVCVWLVLSYQSLEWHKELPDHDANIKWLNQKLNMVHLFHAFFFSSISVVLIVCYSIYYYIHNLQLMIQPNYFIFLTLALLFFYSLSQHFHNHVYMIFVVMVPVILVSSVYWMSWFAMSKEMRFIQWTFIVMHSLVYACLIFYRNKIIFIGKHEDMDENRYGKPHKLRGNVVWAMERGGLHAILRLVIIICYSVSWVVPILTQRIEGGRAEYYIREVCKETNIKVDEMIELAKERCAYDVENQDYDRGKYLKFMYEELHEQILDKGMIDDENTFLTYEELVEWYPSAP
jgi:Phosphoglycerol transferase and related proteins, alkaline phosphatase superfamily